MSLLVLKLCVQAPTMVAKVDEGKPLTTIQLKVDVRLPGKGSSNSHGARPVHLIITMIMWIRTSRLTIKKYPSVQAPTMVVKVDEEKPLTTIQFRMHDSTRSLSLSLLLSSLELSDTKVYEP